MAKELITALKVRISGSYRKAGREVVDYMDIEGIIPKVDIELAEQAVRKRYATMWIKNDPKRFPERLETIREVHIDVMEDIEVDQFSFVGKNIMQMSAEEIQDMAVANDLKMIPLFKKTSLRQAQNVAYAQYALNVLKLQPGRDDPEHPGAAMKAYELLTNYKVEGFNIAKNPAITVGGEIRRDKTGRLSNEEMINLEQKSTSTKGPKNTLTLDDLFAIAAEKNITHAPNIGFDTLYARLFNANTGEAKSGEAAQLPCPR